MADFGLDENGLNIKTLADIKSEVEEALRATFGPQINLTPQSVYGQIVGTFSDREALIWELVELIFNSQYPAGATGVSFDNVLDLVGLKRLGALESIISGLAMFGTAGTIILQGTQFSVNGSPDDVFSTNTDVTLIAGTDEVQDITFSTTPTGGSFKLDYNDEITAAILFSEGAAEVQTALRNLTGTSDTGITVTGSFAAGFTITFAGDDGKQEQPILVENSNTLTNGGAVTIAIAETTPGVYQGQSNCIALDTGPISVAEKALSVIDNPVSGLVSVFNPTVASIGRDRETDPEGKIRRGESLQISTAGPPGAIDNKIFKLNEEEDKTTILYAHTFENFTSSVDSRGIPAHAFESFVYLTGGATDRDQEILQAIFDSKPAGIEPHGDVSGSVADSEGLDHTIKFSRPTAVPIYLILDLTVTSAYPSDGDAQVESLMVEWGGGLGVGGDVIVSPSLVAQLDPVPGIIGVVVKIGIAPAPTLDNNIVIDDGVTPGVVVELSTWSAANITVNS